MGWGGRRWGGGGIIGMTTWSMLVDLVAVSGRVVKELCRLDYRKFSHTIYRIINEWYLDGLSIV